MLIKRGKVEILEIINNDDEPVAPEISNVDVSLPKAPEKKTLPTLPVPKSTLEN